MGLLPTNKLTFYDPYGRIILIVYFSVKIVERAYSIGILFKTKLSPSWERNPFVFKL